MPRPVLLFALRGKKKNADLWPWTCLGVVYPDVCFPDKWINGINGSCSLRAENPVSKYALLLGLARGITDIAHALLAAHFP